MAKTFQDTITVTFKGEGKGLEKTIKDLDRATKALLQTQASMQKLGTKQVKQHTKAQKAMIALDAKLKSLGKRFKHAGISNETLTRAYKGSRVALIQVKRATDAYTASLKVNRKGILSTVHDTRILGGSFAVLRSKLLLASFATSLVGMSIGKLLRKQAEQEKAEKTLSLALGFRSQALLDYASAQQKVTKFGDEETISAMALVGAYTMDEEAIKKVTKASMELASGRGMDLKSAIDMVSKSIFSGTNALTRYGIEIGDATTQEEKLVAITERLTKMYGGQSEQSGTLAQRTDQLGNSIGDVGEKFGALLTPAVMSSMSAIKKWTDSIDQADVNTFTKNLVTLTSTWYAYRVAVVLSNMEMTKLVWTMKTAQVAMVRTGIGALVVTLGYFIHKMIELSGWFDVASDKSKELTDQINALRKAQEALRAGELDEATRAKFAKAEEELREATRKKTEAFYEEIKALKIKNELATTTTDQERIRIKMGEEWVNTHKALVVAMLVEMGTEARLLEMKNKRLEAEKRASALASRVKSALDSTTTEQIAKLLQVKNALESDMQKVINKTAKMSKEEWANHLDAIENINNEIKLLKNPVDNVVDSYEKWALTLAKGQKDKVIEDEWIAKLTDRNWKYVKALKELGLIKKTEAEQGATSAIAGTVIMREKAIQATIKQLELEKALIELSDKDPETSDKQLEKYDAIIEAIKNQKDALIDLNETKKASMAESIDMGLEQFQQATGAYSSFVQGAVDSDINALKARDSYQRASTEQRAVMEEDVRRKHSSALRRTAILEKAGAVAQATINTSEAVTKALPNIPLAGLVGALGAVQIASIIATPLAYKQGGLVGGRSHEQGGTIIEAERGEYVMSRNAVESIGVEALNSMNQGGGAITVNISAPLVDETVIDHIIPAIQKAQRMNLA